MFCIDWDDLDEPYQIQGYEFDNDYARLEIRVLPCNYIHTQMGFEGDSVSSECIRDLEKQIEYMGPVHLLIYMN